MNSVIPDLEQSFPSPIGTLTVALDRFGRVVCLRFPGSDAVDTVSHTTAEDLDPAIRLVAHQLDEYFSGSRRSFKLDLSPRGTEFERRVWDAMCAIPYGETRSYGDIARQLGSPDASRAVGRASGRNPIPILIPCHRVVGAQGQLTGFGGGLELKAKLLALESPNRSLPFE